MAGSTSDIKMTMIEMTTSSSTSVNARRTEDCVRMTGLLKRVATSAK
jgi:hypothetical protein